MAVRAEDVGSGVTPIRRLDPPPSDPAAPHAEEVQAWRLRHERAVARAEAAEAQAEEWRRAEIAARSELGSLKGIFTANRKKLIEARDEAKAIRCAAGNAVSLQEEVQRLTELLAAARVDPGKRSTAVSMRMQIAELRDENGWLRERLGESLGVVGPRGSGARSRDALAERARNQGELIKSLRTERDGLRKQVTRLTRERDQRQKRLDRKAERSESLKETARTLHRENIELRRQLRYNRVKSETLVRLYDEVKWLRLDLKGSQYGKKKLKERVVKLRASGATLSKLPSDEAAQLRNALRRSRRQKTTIRSLRRENARLRRAVRVSSTRRDALQGQVGRLRANGKRLSKRLSAESDELRKALRRSRRHKSNIRSLSRDNARLRKAVRKALKREASLEMELTEVRASRAVLSRRMYGRRSEQQDKPRSKRRRGQQSGAPGHGRTQRPGIEERIETPEPPEEARVCSGCGTAYVANGERCTTIVEIDVKAHTRRIVRPRWRRRCDCADVPMEVVAPAPDRLFPKTPYGTTVWSRVLFERYVCHRPLNGVADWLTRQGLALSAGTLGNRVKDFVPLFEPLAEAILEHQHAAPVRHGDETGWRIQELRETGRSGRAWLWVSVTVDAVYFHIDPSRSAEAALLVFGDATAGQVLVVDRYSVYKKLARVLDGRVTLAWCWSHQRRDFIDCAAGQPKLSRWCRDWLGRIAAIYRLNKSRLSHCRADTGERDEGFADAQRELESQLQALFATAEGGLEGLDGAARQAAPLRSLLNHREGLSVFLENPPVPMDNNVAERTLRGAVIGRRLSFGSDSEEGARLTALMYSAVETLALNRIDVRLWLTEWLKACAANGGRAPPDLSEWLPWSMSRKRRRALTDNA
ncbi:MAG: IS66 family transposase [Rhodospirillales bacterium]|nr:IS66 family transposase [Rhodospirillales bacterium]